MIKLNDFRIGWRQLVAEPAYSAVVLLGLAIAIGCTYLIAAFVGDTLWTDPDVPESARVVSFEYKPNMGAKDRAWTERSPFILRADMLEAKAPLLNVTRTYKAKDGQTLRVGERVIRVDTMAVDPEFVELFAVKPLVGDLVAALTRPDGVALTEDTAMRLFGDKNVLGRQLESKGKTFTVLALVPTPSGNSQLQYEALAAFDGPMNNAKDVNFSMDMWDFIMGNVYARLAPGASAAQLSQLAQTLHDAKPMDMGGTPEERTKMGPMGFMRATPLDRMLLEGANSAPRRILMGSLLAAAGAMLALAAINYINLSSVRILRRQREIGIRKSLGASPGRLVAQFLSEAVLVALLAGVIGLLLAWLMAPAFTDLMQHRFDGRLLTLPKILTAVMTCVALGVLTGLYPAWVALKVNCAESLAGRSHAENLKGRLARRAMTTLQFAAAITLSAMAVVVLWQTHYAQQIKTGFRQTDLLAIELPRATTDDAARGLRDALLRDPSVMAVANSRDVAGRGRGNLMASLSANGKDLTTTVFQIGPKFFDVYELPVLAGRIADDLNAETDNGVVLDRAAVKGLGFASPQDAIGKIVGAGADKTTVVAVVENGRLENAHVAVEPKVYLASKAITGVLTVRSKDMAATRLAVEAAWPRYYPNDLAIVESVTSYIAQNYKEDRRLGGLIAGASVIALLLASFGVYALAAYTVQQKTREIVIRKLHGADSKAIASLLLREFRAMLLLGMLLGLPLAWLLSQRYLASFVERAPMGLWPLLAALLVALTVSGLATLRHTLAALALRPTLALQG